MSEPTPPKRRHRICYLVARHEDGRVTRIGSRENTRFVEGDVIHRAISEHFPEEIEGWTYDIQVGPPTPVYLPEAQAVEDRRDQVHTEGFIAQFGICWTVFSRLALLASKGRGLDSNTQADNYGLSYWYGDHHGRTWVEAYQLTNPPKPPPPTPGERATTRAVNSIQAASANTSDVDLEAVAASLRQALATVEAAQRKAAK